MKILVILGCAKWVHLSISTKCFFTKSDQPKKVAKLECFSQERRYSFIGMRRHRQFNTKLRLNRFYCYWFCMGL